MVERSFTGYYTLIMLPHSRLRGPCNYFIVIFPAYGPPKGNPFGVLSPCESGIGSGVTSGVTTNAHSAVAEGDLEDFKDEEPGSAGFPPYQQPPFPEQQTRGKIDRVQ